MKTPLLLFLMLLAAAAQAQDKFNYTAFNKLYELDGTPIVIATVENRGKTSKESSQLLFINTQTGEHRQTDFPAESWIEKVEQIKIEALQLNCVLVAARTSNTNGDKSIGWQDPKQLSILSADGSKKAQVTDSNYFVSTYAVNKQTGTLVITGHYDSNNNGKYDKTDKHEVLLYDIAGQKMIKKI